MWQNPQGTMDLVTFTDKILHRKLHFFYSVPQSVSLSQCRKAKYWLLIYLVSTTVIGAREKFDILTSPDALISIHFTCRYFIFFDLKPDLGQKLFD